MPLRLGLVLNPLAGVGGPAGLKGSDGDETVRQAEARGSFSQVSERVSKTLSDCLSFANELSIVTAPGEMGQLVCQKV